MEATTHLFSPREAQAAGVSRRTLVKGAAWSVPVVAAAIAAPLAAASTTAVYTTSVLSLEVAPAWGRTADGDEGVRKLLNTNQTFNTFAVVRNDGPDAAPDLRAQLTFPEEAFPVEGIGYSVNAPWVIESQGYNSNLGRWVVNVYLGQTVESEASAPTIIMTNRTKLASGFPVGQSGAYQVLARSFNSDATPSPVTQNDYFYVLRD